MFPYSLFAENQTYKVPRNSISYFVENSGSEKVAIVEPPEPLPPTKTPEKAAQKIIVEQSPSLTEQNNTGSVELKEEKFSMSWKTDPNEKKENRDTADPYKKTSQKVIVRSQQKTTPAPIVTQIKAQKQEIKEPESQEVVTTTSSSPFAKTLTRMQSRGASRAAEAEKLGIVLPSQGGDMQAVSPSLSKLNQAIKNIISRN
jgi:hypothetical protein